MPSGRRRALVVGAALGACVAGVLAALLLRGGPFPREHGTDACLPSAPLVVPSRITAEWRAEGRTQLASVLRVRPASAGFVPVATPIEGFRGAAGLVSRLYRFTLSDGSTVIGVTLVPEGGGNGAWVLVLHGHGPGLRVVFDPNSYQKGIALALAKGGFSVFAVETRSFGDSLVDRLPHDVYVNRLLVEGRVFHGEVVSDNRELLNWLGSSGGWTPGQPLGVVGCSMGGLSAMFLSALDDRMQATLVSGMGGSWRGSFSSQRHCHCSMIPGLLRYLDSPQIVALSRCPQIAFELGRQDALLGVGRFRSVAQEMRSIEGKGGPAINVHEFEGGHEHDVPFVLEFCRRALLIGRDAGPSVDGSVGRR